MKRLFLILAIASLFVGCSSKKSDNLCKCRIEGRLDNYNAIGEVYLTDGWSAYKVITKAKLNDNTFVIEDLKSAPTFARLMLESGRPVADLFIEDGEILVSGDYLLGTIRASGTPANDAFSEMMVRNYDLLERRRNAIGAGDQASVKAIDAEVEEMLKEYLKNNKDNIFGVYVLQQLSQTISAKQMLDVLSSMPQSLQNIKAAKRLKSLAERRFKTEPQVEGSDYVPHYINIVQPNLDGEEVSLKSVVEKSGNRYVLLDFWWSSSVEEMPMLKQAYSLYYDKGFDIYGVSLDRRKEFWKETIDEQGIEWTTVSSLEEFNMPAVNDYAVEPKLFPNFLIDCSNGVIVAKNLRGEALLDKLAELLK